MSNSFSKEERVAFEQLLEGFQDALVLSRQVSTYSTDMQEMERTGDVIWRPQPYISQSFSGMDQTANFRDYIQLSVPATIGYSRAVPWTLDAKQLRDALQEQRLGESAKQKLASDINLAVMNTAAFFGTLVVKRSAAMIGYDDVAQAEAIMNEQGVDMDDRSIAISTRDYNSGAANLADRQAAIAGKTLTAYEKSLIGRVASFDTFKLDYALRKTAAAGVTCTINGANQYYVPRAVSVAVTGEMSNVDNRFQTVAISVTSGSVQPGDSFNIAGVDAVHHITKQDTGQLKTFRIISQSSGASGGSGGYVISPPIISGGGGSDAELEYQNVTATPANGAAITWLNTATNFMNPFWHRDAIEILPGRYAIPADAGAAVIRASTDQGIELVMQKFYDINTMKTKYRLDTLYGTVMKQPEMAGIMMFSQP